MLHSRAYGNLEILGYWCQGWTVTQALYFSTVYNFSFTLIFQICAILV